MLFIIIFNLILPCWKNIIPCNTTLILILYSKLHTGYCKKNHIWSQRGIRFRDTKNRFIQKKIYMIFLMCVNVFPEHFGRKIYCKKLFIITKIHNIKCNGANKMGKNVHILIYTDMRIKIYVCTYNTIRVSPFDLLNMRICKFKWDCNIYESLGCFKTGPVWRPLCWHYLHCGEYPLHLLSIIANLIQLLHKCMYLVFIT